MLLSLPAGFRGEGVSKAGNSRLFGGGGYKIRTVACRSAADEPPSDKHLHPKRHHNNNNSWMEAVSEKK